MHFVKVVLCFTLFNLGQPAALPIWNLLSHHEKVAKLAYRFIYLVEDYCKNSEIPDCNAVYTLYGISVLVKLDESALDHLEPYHRNADYVIWKTLMEGSESAEDDKKYDLRSDEKLNEIEEVHNQIGTDYPAYDHYYSDYDESDSVNDPHPYAIKVAPPSTFTHLGVDKKTGSKKTSIDEKFNYPKTEDQDTVSTSTGAAKLNNEGFEQQDVHVPATSDPIADTKDENFPTTTRESTSKAPREVDTLPNNASVEEEEGKESLLDASTPLTENSNVQDNESDNYIVSNGPFKET